MSETVGVSAAPAYGRVSVSGSDITVNGDASARFFGVVDTTALQFAIMAYINGDKSVAGKTSVFPGPDTGSNSRMSQNASPEEFWHQYFALLSYYDCNLVRIGAGDTWGTGLQYQAWLNHHDQYIDLLEIMLDEAYEHGVWVVLVLAGSQAESDAPYHFGGSGSSFVATSDAFNKYVTYSRDVMAALEPYNSLGWYDLWNEPDHDQVYTNYWQNNGGKTAFNNWARAIASATAGASTHPRTLGVAGYGKMFGMTQADFDLSTGKTGFEIAHRHYYASANDANNFNLPAQWAKNDGVPLFWGELAYNGVYPLTRWTFAENTIYANGGQAIASMVLTGTSKYPYTGGTLPDPANPPAPPVTPEPEPEPEPELPALEITSVPGTSALAGSGYSYEVTTTEAATLTVSTNAPFLKMGVSNGTLYGTPTKEQVGSYAVNITTTTSDSRTATQDYVLTVSYIPAEEPPANDPVPEVPVPDPDIKAKGLSALVFVFSLVNVTADSIEWDFDDGSQESGTEVTHTFRVGKYTVTVTWVDESHRVQSTKQEITIAPNGSDETETPVVTLPPSSTSGGSGKVPSSPSFILGGGHDATILAAIAGYGAIACLYVFAVFRRKI